MAEIMGGTPGGSIGEPFNMPLTAHFIGGCAIGDSPETGVVDPYQRVYGHPGLHVADGSAISANLGVNPSLTITAQAERAMAFWPNKGEADPRPELGATYQPVAAGRAGPPGRAGVGARGAAAADRRRLLSRLLVELGPSRNSAPRGSLSGRVPPSNSLPWRGPRPGAQLAPDPGPGLAP